VQESTIRESGLANASAPNRDASELAALTRWAYQRGWVPATSGNFSIRLSVDPFRLAITASGRDKGTLTESDVVVVDESGAAVDSDLRPSAETLLHILIARERGARVVAHVHSMWATLASERAGERRTIELTGLELLKAFDGVTTHEQSVQVPVIDNSQDWSSAVPAIARTLESNPTSHGFLIRGHGLYTWAGSVAGVRRHLEAFEYLFEYETRRSAIGLI
jgi:methylthioribulose-1-phosphate dehydratase